MITFQEKEIELDKPLYVICGTYDTRGRRTWFPVHFGDEERYDEYKAFKCRIDSVTFSPKAPGKIIRIELWANAISEDMHVYLSGGAYVGRTAQEARKTFTERRSAERLKDKNRNE